MFMQDVCAVADYLHSRCVRGPWRRHCRRIVPVELIAPLEDSALAAAAQSAAAAFLSGAAGARLPRPCTYAGELS